MADAVDSLAGNSLRHAMSTWWSTIFFLHCSGTSQLHLTACRSNAASHLGIFRTCAKFPPPPSAFAGQPVVSFIKRGQKRCQVPFWKTSEASWVCREGEQWIQVHASLPFLSPTFHLVLFPLKQNRNFHGCGFLGRTMPSHINRK